MSFDFGLAVDKFRSLRDELQVRVQGGKYKIPGTDDIVEFHGINYADEIRDILKNSTKKDLSYVALRDSERIITDIQDVRFSAMIIKVELKSVISRSDLPKNPQLSSHYKVLKDIQTKIEGYLEICDKQYSYIQEILFGVSQVNISINRRFFNGEENQFRY